MFCYHSCLSWKWPSAEKTTNPLTSVHQKAFWHWDALAQFVSKDGNQMGTFFVIRFDNNNILNVKKCVRYACSTTGTPKEELVFKEQELFMPHYCADGSWNTSFYPLYKANEGSQQKHKKICDTGEGKAKTHCPSCVCSSQGKTVNKKSKIFITWARSSQCSFLKKNETIIVRRLVSYVSPFRIQAPAVVGVSTSYPTSAQVRPWLVHSLLGE